MSTHRVTITFEFNPDNPDDLPGSGVGWDRECRTPEGTAAALTRLYIPGCLTKNIVSIVAEDATITFKFDPDEEAALEELNATPGDAEAEWEAYANDASA